MATWDVTFEAQPGDGFNPGGGAASIRELKTAISERLNRSHYWGSDESTTQGEYGGQHKEGSARAFISDGSESGRTNQSTPTMASEAVGLVRIDVTPLEGTARRRQGDEYLDDIAGYSTRDQARRTLEIVGTDPITDTPAIITVFDYDKLVDIIANQTIEGIKTFISAPLSSETVVIDDDYDSADADKLVGAQEIHDWGEEGKYHNLYDPTDADNQAYFGIGPNDPVPLSLNCQSVKGIVWTD